MAVLSVRTFPEMCLVTPSRPVDQGTPQVLALIRDLTDTMRHYPRCVGLAAPQVGANVRVAVVDVTGHPKAKGARGSMILVNPRIIAFEGGLIQREGCLSIPDFTANVQRAARVQVRALDGSGRTWTRWLSGFEAIAVQHEIDHLDGKLFLDRVVNLKTDLFRRKRYWFPPGRASTPPSAHGLRP